MDAQGCFSANAMESLGFWRFRRAAIDSDAPRPHFGHDSLPTRPRMPTESTPHDLTALPLLPLRDVVVFPHMVIPLFVGRAKSIKALEAAMEAGKSIVLVAQKS